jgi:hypothetical protein
MGTGELPDGHLRSHALAMNVGPATHHQYNWDGAGWSSIPVPPSAIHVIPARAPHAVRWDEPVETLVVQTVGLSPHRYVLRARIDRAKALLGDTRRSVSEVAPATGFATPSHFATTFRRVTGATPRAYRGSLRQRRCGGRTPSGSIAPGPSRRGRGRGSDSPLPPPPPGGALRPCARPPPGAPAPSSS